MKTTSPASTARKHTISPASDDKFNERTTKTTKSILGNEDKDETFKSCRDTLESYWELFEIPNGDDHSQQLVDAASDVFANDAIWESQRLEQPILGKQNIIQHIQRIKTYTIDGIKTRSEPIIQYKTIDEGAKPTADGEMIITATWDWKVTRYSDKTTILGTDYVEFCTNRPIQNCHHSQNSHDDNYGDEGNEGNNKCRFLIQRISISKPPPSNTKQ